MSWLGRLFGGSPTPSPPANSVVVDEALVQQLTSGGLALDVAVDAALRSYLDAEAKAARAEAEGRELEGIPFWLRRESENAGDIDDELRDRVIQRQSGAEDGDGTPGKQMELGT
jgi:hypothetical protein